jgi:hypothetical protein
MPVSQLLKSLNVFGKIRGRYQEGYRIPCTREKSETAKYVELYNTFDEIEDGLVYTEFKTERVMLNISVNLQDITLLELFNHLVLCEEIPFATCKNYYKILKDYVPPEEWAISTEDKILLKMYEKQIIDTEKQKDYTDVNVAVGDEGSHDGSHSRNAGNVKVNVKLITERGYLSRDQFIDRFRKAFHGLEKNRIQKLVRNRCYRYLLLSTGKITHLRLFRLGYE